MKKINYLLLAGFIFLTGILNAQNIDNKSLEKERADIQRDLNAIQRSYNANKSISREDMIQLTTINRRIDGQQRYLQSMSNQSFVSSDVYKISERDINGLKQQFERLRDAYYGKKQDTDTKDNIVANSATARTTTPNYTSSAAAKYRNPYYIPDENEKITPKTQAPTPNKPASQRSAPNNRYNSSYASSYVPTGSYASLTGDFAQFHGQLPYPTDKGSITQGFGRYKIEGYGPNILGDNPGCTFSAPVNAPVKAVFQGEVISVSRLGNMSYVVLRHGKYCTAYSNLATANITKGMQVAPGQVIGTVGADDETGYGKLDFILMVDDKNIDPKSWFITR